LTAARVRELFEAVPEQQQLRSLNAREERQPDRQMSPVNPGRHDEVGKAGEVGDVGRGHCASARPRQGGAA